MSSIEDLISEMNMQTADLYKLHRGNDLYDDRSDSNGSSGTSNGSSPTDSDSDTYKPPLYSYEELLTNLACSDINVHAADNIVSEDENEKDETEETPLTIASRLRQLITEKGCLICQVFSTKHFVQSGHIKGVRNWIENELAKVKQPVDWMLLFCQVCNQPLSGNKEAGDHYLESSHIEKSNSFCKICSRVISAIDMPSHRKSKKHLKMEASREATSLPGTNEDAATNLVTQPKTSYAPASNVPSCNEKVVQGDGNRTVRSYASILSRNNQSATSDELRKTDQEISRVLINYIEPDSGNVFVKENLPGHSRGSPSPQLMNWLGRKMAPQFIPWQEWIQAGFSQDLHQAEKKTSGGFVGNVASLDEYPLLKGMNHSYVASKLSRNFTINDTCNQNSIYSDNAETIEPEMQCFDAAGQNNILNSSLENKTTSDHNVMEDIENHAADAHSNSNEPEVDATEDKPQRRRRKRLRKKNHKIARTDSVEPPIIEAAGQNNIASSSLENKTTSGHNVTEDIENSAVDAHSNSNESGEIIEPEVEATEDKPQRRRRKHSKKKNHQIARTNSVEPLIVEAPLPGRPVEKAAANVLKWFDRKPSSKLLPWYQDLQGVGEETSRGLIGNIASLDEYPFLKGMDCRNVAGELSLNNTLSEDREQTAIGPDNAETIESKLQFFNDIGSERPRRESNGAASSSSVESFPIDEAVGQSNLLENKATTSYPCDENVAELDNNSGVDASPKMRGAGEIIEPEVNAARDGKVLKNRRKRSRRKNRKAESTYSVESPGVEGDASTISTSVIEISLSEWIVFSLQKRLAWNYCYICHEHTTKGNHYRQKVHYDNLAAYVKQEWLSFGITIDDIDLFFCLACHVVLSNAGIAKNHYKSEYHKRIASNFCYACLVHDRSVVHKDHPQRQIMLIALVERFNQATPKCAPVEAKDDAQGSGPKLSEAENNLQAAEEVKDLPDIKTPAVKLNFEENSVNIDEANEESDSTLIMDCSDEISKFKSIISNVFSCSNTRFFSTRLSSFITYVRNFRKVLAEDMAFEADTIFQYSAVNFPSRPSASAFLMLDECEVLKLTLLRESDSICNFANDRYFSEFNEKLLIVLDEWSMVQELFDLVKDNDALAIDSKIVETLKHIVDMFFSYHSSDFEIEDMLMYYIRNFKRLLEEARPFEIDMVFELNPEMYRAKVKCARSIASIKQNIYRQVNELWEVGIKLVGAVRCEQIVDQISQFTWKLLVLLKGHVTIKAAKTDELEEEIKAFKSVLIDPLDFQQTYVALARIRNRIMYVRNFKEAISDRGKFQEQTIFQMNEAYYPDRPLIFNALKFVCEYDIYKLTLYREIDEVCKVAKARSIESSYFSEFNRRFLWHRDNDGSDDEDDWSFKSAQDNI